MNPLEVLLRGICIGVAGAFLWAGVWTVLLPGVWDGHDTLIVPVFFVSAFAGALGPFFVKH